MKPLKLDDCVLACLEEPGAEDAIAAVEEAGFDIERIPADTVEVLRPNRVC